MLIVTKGEEKKGGKERIGWKSKKKKGVREAKENILEDEIDEGKKKRKGERNKKC